MSTGEILKLVDQLYGQSGDKAAKAEADKKLQIFQATTASWKISLEILSNSNSAEAYYFAANTLRTKVQNNFKELSDNLWQTIRDTILEVLFGPTVFTKSTYSQLSVAVAHLALQSEEWHNCLLHLKKCVNDSSTVRKALVVVQILQYIPEDIDSKRLQLGENRRNLLKCEFSQDAPQCIDLFTSLIKIQTSEREEVLLRVFKCLTSWLRADLIHTSCIDRESICDIAFHLLKDNSTEAELHEVLTDFVCSTVQACFSQATSEQFLSKVYEGVLQLREPYIMSVAHEDSDKSQNYVAIFASTAEVFMDSIQLLTNSGVGSKVLLDILLDCCGHYDFEIALHTFNFWFSFADSISRQQSNEAQVAQFSAYFERLIVSLFRLCQLEPDRSDLLSLKDDFFEFRNLARDLIMEAVQIVHPMKIIAMSKNILDTQTSWESQEAAIFVLNAVAKFIHRDENEVTPLLFERILAIGQQQTHVCLDYAVLQFLGELGVWVSNHPNFLEGIIQFIATRLSCRELNDCASNALLNICTANAQQLAPHFDALCELLKYFDLQKQKSSEDLIHGLAAILNHKPNEELKSGFEKLVKYCVESAANSAAVQNQQTPSKPPDVVLSPETEKSASESANPNNPLRPYVPVMDRLSILLQHVRPRDEIPHVTGEENVEHPCKQVIGQILPLILGILHQYKLSEKISEKGCRTLRYAIRCLGLHFDSLLADLVQNMVDLYAQNGFSCYLYLGGIVVDEFGTNSQYHQGLSALFDQFSVKALNQFSEDDGFRNHPDTVDDFYRLSIRITQKCPLVLLHSDKFAPVFDAAICALHLDHKEGLISVVEFIDTLFTTAARQQNPDFTGTESNSTSNENETIQHLPPTMNNRAAAVAQGGGDVIETGTQSEMRRRMADLLTSHGNKLLTQALAAALFSLPRYLIPDVSLVFQTVSLFDHNSYCLLLAHAFEVLAQREETKVKNVSDQQLRHVYNCIVQDYNYRAVSRSLKHLVKFYR